MARVARQFEKSKIQVNQQWCKGCGICTIICGKNVFLLDRSGKTVAVNPVNCTGCGRCETHCPDFALTVEGV